MDSYHKPPAFMLKLLKLFCKPSYHLDIEGDLLEIYNHRLATMSRTQANWKFFKDILLLFRPGILKSFFDNQETTPPTMIRYYIILAIRNLKRNRSSSLVNLMSLTIGLVCTILIYLWIVNELRVDKFHTKDERLYQIMLNEPTPNGIETYANTQGLLAQTIADELPNVDQSVSVVPYEWFEGERFVVSDGGEKLFVSKNQFASDDYFEIFSFGLLEGDPSKVLDSPDNVVISEGLAMKLYGSTQATGNTLEWLHDDYGGPYKVSGVFAELPAQSTAQFDAVFHYDVFLEDDDDHLNWYNSDPYTYATLQPTTNLTDFNDQLTQLLDSKIEGNEQELFVQRYSDHYLHDRFENGIPVGGRIEYIQLFAIIAIFVMIIACVNFTNMSIAQAIAKVKDIGVKKALGANRTHLGLRHLSEAWLLTLLATILSLGLVWLLLPQFSLIIGTRISLTWDINLTLTLLGLVLFTGLISGLYPALHLAGLQPTIALRGQVNTSINQMWTTRALLMAQFLISSVLITGTLIVYRQMEHIQSKELGYSKDNVVWFTMNKPQDKMGVIQELSEESIEVFLQRLKNTPGVVNTANFAHNMFGDYGTTTGLNWPGKDPSLDAQVAGISGGYDFLQTMDIELVEGRLFSRDYAADQSKIIFNQTAITEMGLSDPIGKSVELWGDQREIVGVVKDFHFASLHQRIRPLFLKVDANDFSSNVAVRLEKGNEQATLLRIEALYREYFMRGAPFDYQFMQDDFERMYAQEKRISILTRYAAGAAIFLSCLGLFAFTAFIIQRRQKEVAIRKVLGANMSSLTVLLTRPFVIIGGLAVVISIPLSYYLSATWMEGFAYRISLSWVYFVLAGIMVIAIATVTAGYQSYGLSRKNPSEDLNHE